MDLEKVALEAVKVKIQEIFDEILVSTYMEGRDIVIRIKLPDEIMNSKQSKVPFISGMNLEDSKKFVESGLDKEATEAAKELLGTQDFKET